MLRGDVTGTVAFDQRLARGHAVGVLHGGLAMLSDVRVPVVLLLLTQLLRLLGSEPVNCGFGDFGGAAGCGSGAQPCVTAAVSAAGVARRCGRP